MLLSYCDSICTSSYGELSEKCKKIIHCYAPDGFCASPDDQASALRKCFASISREVRIYGGESVALPAIGCGVKRYCAKTTAVQSLECIYREGRSCERLKYVDVIFADKELKGRWERAHAAVRKKESHSF